MGMITNKEYQVSIHLFFTFYNIPSFLKSVCFLIDIHDGEGTGKRRGNRRVSSSSSFLSLFSLLLRNLVAVGVDCPLQEQRRQVEEVEKAEDMKEVEEAEEEVVPGVGAVEADR